MNRTEVIKLENVWFSYNNQPFLQNVNLPIYSDDFVGIVGPNGGGKTTLLKLMLGLLKPQQGKITIMGKSPREGRSSIGYLSQFKNIDFDFPITARQIVLLSLIGRKLLKHYSQKDKAAADKALKDMGIWHLRDKKLNELSGGEKQRVFVARALANEPQVLVLDEPMSNLDMHIQEEFYKILQKLNQQIAIVIVDHDLDMLVKFAREVVCVNKCSTHAIHYHDSDEVKLMDACNVKESAFKDVE